MLLLFVYVLPEFSILFNEDVEKRSGRGYGETDDGQRHVTSKESVVPKGRDVENVLTIHQCVLQSL